MSLSGLPCFTLNENCCTGDGLALSSLSALSSASLSHPRVITSLVIRWSFLVVAVMPTEIMAKPIKIRTCNITVSLDVKLRLSRQLRKRRVAGLADRTQARTRSAGRAFLALILCLHFGKRGVSEPVDFCHCGRRRARDRAYRAISPSSATQTTGASTNKISHPTSMRSPQTFPLPSWSIDRERSGRHKYDCNPYSVPYQEIYHRFCPFTNRNATCANGENL